MQTAISRLPHLNRSGGKRVAILGGGSIGMMLAGAFASVRQGSSGYLHDVHIFSNRPAIQKSLIEQGGLYLSDGTAGRLTPKADPVGLDRELRSASGPLLCPVKLLQTADTSLHGTFDAVFLCGKGEELRDRSARLAKTLLPPAAGAVVSLMNGAGHYEAVLRECGWAEHPSAGQACGAPFRPAVLVGTTSIGAAIPAAAPGQPAPSPASVALTGFGNIIIADDTHRGTPTPASPSSPSALSPELTSVASALRAALAPSTVVEEAAARRAAVVWGKLVVNIVMNPLTALLRVRNGALQPVARRAIALAQQRLALLRDAALDPAALGTAGDASAGDGSEPPPPWTAVDELADQLTELEPDATSAGMLLALTLEACRIGIASHALAPLPAHAEALSAAVPAASRAAMRHVAVVELQVALDALHRVLGIAEAAATNTTSMLADVASLRATEAPYILGYALRRADELGVAAPTLRAVTGLMQLRDDMLLPPAQGDVDVRAFIS